MNDEIWVPAFGWRAYEVSSLGRVRSLRSKHGERKVPKLLNDISIRGGYKVIRLNSPTVKNKGVLVHRLVFESFSGKKIPVGLEVNHINQVTCDNRLCNLELLTHRENVNYGDGVARRVAKTQKKVVGESPNGDMVIFESARHAATAAHTTRSMVYAIVGGRKRTVHGWRFRAP